MLDNQQKTVSRDDRDLQVFDDSGILRQHVQMKDSKPHGKLALFDQHQRITQESNYSLGELHGEQKLYSSNQLRAVFQYVNGKRHGSAWIYGTTGVIASEMEYMNGELEGERRDYDIEGRIVGRSFYKNGQREGDLHTYYPNGNVQGVSAYRNDVLHGEAKYYDQDGGLIQRKYYDDGKLAQPSAIQYQKSSPDKGTTLSGKKSFPFSKTR